MLFVVAAVANYADVGIIMLVIMLVKLLLWLSCGNDDTFFVLARLLSLAAVVTCNVLRKRVVVVGCVVGAAEIAPKDTVDTVDDVFGPVLELHCFLRLILRRQFVDVVVLVGVLLL